jgi:hypothetical protein
MHQTKYVNPRRTYAQENINVTIKFVKLLNPLNAELNSICPLLALFGAHHILHVSRISVKLLMVFRLRFGVYKIKAYHSFTLIHKGKGKVHPLYRH